MCHALKTAQNDALSELERFLQLRIDTPQQVFDIFRTLPGAVEKHGSGRKGFLYVPGTRKDRCLLAAHADTYFDRSYLSITATGEVLCKNGIYFSGSAHYGLGADDRAGCAILWLLRNSGHSLLITDGEEHGQIGAHYLREEFPELFRELNGHSFILQLDRRNADDYKCYDIPVTKNFLRYIEAETGFVRAESPGRTDIVTLCDTVCGANLSVGYRKEHTVEETLCVSEWLHTLDVVRQMLEKPLTRYPTSLFGQYRTSPKTGK